MHERYREHRKTIRKTDQPRARAPSAANTNAREIADRRSSRSPSPPCTCAQNIHDATLRLRQHRQVSTARDCANKHVSSPASRRARTRVRGQGYPVAGERITQHVASATGESTSAPCMRLQKKSRSNAFPHCVFRSAVHETFCVRRRIVQIALDPFDQTHYQFRHHGIVRPALRGEAAGFFIGQRR